MTRLVDSIDPLERESLRVIANSVRSLTYARGMTIPELRSAIGMGDAVFSAALHGLSQAAGPRRRIEAFFRTALWSSPADFAERLPLIDFFGVDIETCTKSQLRQLAREHGQRCNMHQTRPELITILRTHYERAKTFISTPPCNENAKD